MELKNSIQEQLSKNCRDNPELHREFLKRNDASTRNGFVEYQAIQLNDQCHASEILDKNGWKGETEADDALKAKGFPFSGYKKGNDTLKIELIHNKPYSVITINEKEKHILSETAFDVLYRFIHKGNKIDTAIDACVNYVNVILNEDELLKHNETIIAQCNNKQPHSLPLKLADSGFLSAVPQDSLCPYSKPYIKPNHANWAYDTRHQAHQSNLGIFLGEAWGYVTKVKIGKVYVYYDGEGHMTTIGTTGSGKTTACQITTLIHYDSPAVVIDAKGILALRTAKYRRDVLKHNVLILNPTGLLEKELAEIGFESVKYNPLASVDTNGNHYIELAKIISNSIVNSDNKNDSHWNESAAIIIECLIIYVCFNEPPKYRTLSRVRELLTQGQDALVTLFKSIHGKKSMPTALKQKVSILINENEKGIGSIIDSTIRQTDFLSSPLFAANLSSNEINFLDLKDPNKKTTIYIILPLDSMLHYKRWMRLVIETAITQLKSTYRKGYKNVLFMIDECDSLGYMSTFENSIATAREFGVQFWSFWQSPSQIRNHYHNNFETILSNSELIQVLDFSGFEINKLVYERIGHSQIPLANATELQGLQNIQQLNNFRHDLQMLIFNGHQQPFYVQKNYWFNDEWLKSVVHRPTSEAFKQTGA